MDTLAEIDQYINQLPEPKRTEIAQLHQHILALLPQAELWFNNGLNEAGKVVTNPTIGYGRQTLRYANGSSRDFFRIGMGAGSSGIFVYILPVKNKTFLAETYGAAIGKASLSGYCIKFKKLQDIHLDVLDAAITYGMELAV